MEYKHFSHHHTLTLQKIQPGQQQFRCHGCELSCHDSIYACWKCSFFLHEHCGNANRQIKHPSHPLHPLVLMPQPTYCSGEFLCNSCGASGSSYSYCCTLCEVDLHIRCAFLPPHTSHRAHQHEIDLVYSSGKDTSVGYCKICTKELSSTNWSYLCDKPGCEFRVHTFCATDEIKPGLYQDNGSDNQIPDTSTPTDQNMIQPQPADLTPEEFILQVAQMRMEFELAQALANTIAPHQWKP